MFMPLYYQTLVCGILFIISLTTILLWKKQMYYLIFDFQFEMFFFISTGIIRDVDIIVM